MEFDEQIESVYLWFLNLIIMKRYLLLILIACFFFTNCKKEDSASTKDTTFQNDTYSSGDLPSFQLGFDKDEIAGATFGPLVNPYTIESVSLLFGGSSETRDIKLLIYEDNGTSNPGMTVFSKTYTLQGSIDMQSINLSSENIRFENGSFRVGIQMTKAGAPSVAVDDGSDTKQNRNWIKVNDLGTWKANSTLSVNGNWIIRAAVKEEV